MPGPSRTRAFRFQEPGRGDGGRHPGDPSGAWAGTREGLRVCSYQSFHLIGAGCSTAAVGVRTGLDAALAAMAAFSANIISVLLVCGAWMTPTSKRQAGPVRMSALRRYAKRGLPSGFARHLSRTTWISRRGLSASIAPGGSPRSSGDIESRPKTAGYVCPVRAASGQTTMRPVTRIESPGAVLLGCFTGVHR